MIQDGHRIVVRGQAEGDARREVGLEASRDDVGAGALGGYNQVDADVAGAGGPETHAGRRSAPAKVGRLQRPRWSSCLAGYEGH